ncbi:MAG: hypothetical protein APF76_17290 [Desulfitibacter sp. BRH_c19]|nr:MAG: hypothetical protein APF76_17290 [Desulfitibacter sp. BRH_c19]
MTEEKRITEETTSETRNEILGEEIESDQDTIGSEEELSLVEILYGTVTAPNNTFAKLAKRPRIAYSILTVLAIYLFTWLLNLSDLKNAQFGNVIMEEFGEISTELLSNIFILMGIYGLILLFLTWFIVSGTLNLWASLLGSKGNAKGLFACFGFAMLPSVFSEVLQTIINLLRLPNVINTIIVVLSFIWILYLQMVSVRTTQGLSTGISFFIALTPILVFGILMFVSVFLMFAMFFPVYQNFFIT